MAVYKIADLYIDIKNRYKYVDVLCMDYLSADQTVKPDFCVSATEKDIKNDKELFPEATDAYLEAMSIYREISRNILNYNGFIMHASVIEMDGKAFAFAARSGTGKSTHSRLWLDVFGDRVRIINGDKPLLRFIDNKLYVYGTPWCGKERYNINTRAVLDSVCFIERAKTNSIEKLDKNSAIKKIFDQLLLPETQTQAEKFLEMLDILISNVNFFTLRCNMDKDAAVVAYNGMTNGGE